MSPDRLKQELQSRRSEEKERWEVREYVDKDRRIIEMNINEKKKKCASEFRCNCRRARATNNGSQIAVLAEKG